MKQIMRGFVMLVLLSFAMPAIAQPKKSQEISSAKLQSLQTQPTQPVTAPQAELQQILDAIFRPKAVKYLLAVFWRKAVSSKLPRLGICTTRMVSYLFSTMRAVKVFQKQTLPQIMESCMHGI